MGKLQSRGQIRTLGALAWLVYFFSYVTRINFAAILVAFTQAENVSNAAASVITSVLFVTYGVGQLISGYLGDRIPPNELIFGGLLTSVACNVLMPQFSPNIPAMAAIWGVNGLAQAFMWPPLVKILSCALTPEDYARMIPGVSTSSGLATIVIYLVSPLVLRLSGWKTVFYLAAGTAAVAAIVWRTASGRLLRQVDFDRPTARRTAPTEKTAGTGPLWLLLPVLLCSIAVQGMLRDGISTWLPTFLTETFHLESTVSILTGVALPVFHVLVTLVTYRVLVKLHRDVFACICLYFGIVTALLLGLTLFGMHGAALALLLIAVSYGAMHGINSLQTCYVVPCLPQSGNVSFLAGLLNSATYVGSAVATYLFAVISDRFGWNATAASWVIIAAVGLLLSALCGRLLRKVTGRNG